MQLTGERIGQIRVSRILGRGGMGAVYEGFHEKLARRVALKVMHGEQHLGTDARARLVREARTLSQLDHPHICRIYDFIEHESGDILVLELIEGRTLQQAIRDGLTRAEKLRIAQEIAMALVAAHRAGIIHRDLKPENIMVTNSGVVKVLDFGLARWVESSTPAAAEAEAGDAPPESENSPDDDSGATALFPRRFTPARTANDAVATALGAAVGTPVYMSPEQARGETLTAASDMYSFGLVLQVLFTEQLPYRETGAREVMAKAARGETLPASGVTRNIRLLIDRLKALAPSDRPTALDASAQLRRIVDRPMRIARRAAVAAAVLVAVIGTWKYTIDLRRERAAAVAAENDARLRRADADGLIGFMLGDLRSKLEPVGRLDVLDAAASRSLAYLSSLRAEHMTAAELAGTAKALNQLGEVRIAQGSLVAASAAFEKALTFAAAAVAQAPHDVDTQLTLGTTHFWIGDVSLLRKDLPSALQHMDAYRAIAERLSLSHPDDSALAIERAQGEADVGAVIEAQGDPRGALKHYQATAGIDRSEAMRHPDDIDLQAELARMANKMGVVSQKLGDLVEARRQFETEVATYEAVLKKRPAQNQWRQRLSTAHSFLANVLEDLGDDAALAHRKTEVAMDEQLCNLDPANADWQRNLAVASAKLGASLRSGDPRAAVVAVTRAQSLMSALVARDAHRSSWRIDHGAIQWQASRVYLANGDLATARRMVDGALSTFRGEAHDPAGALRLADAMITSGDIAAAEHDSLRARRAWSAAAEALRPFTAAAGEPRFLAAWARALARLGRADEARPFLARLASMGYANADIAAARNSSRGAPRKQEGS